MCLSACLTVNFAGDIFNIGRVIWGNKYEKREERQEENVKENEGTTTKERQK
jgi:hypothetical protein